MTDTAPLPSPTSEASALAAIITWSAECPNWQRDALRRLYAQEKLTPPDHEALLAICKGTTAEFLPLDATHVRAASAGSAVVTLKALHGLQHVNALAHGERLTFDKTGITIIYGDNGAGKSGYARVLKKACRARMPRGETVLSNVYGDPGVPSASIDFCIGSQNQGASWLQGLPSDAMLSAVSVFDSRTANIHVDQPNDLAYTPLPLKLLSGLAQECQELKSRLAAEAKVLESQKPAVLVTPDCRATTQVGKLMAALSAKTKPADVTALATLTIEQLARLEMLKADLGADPARTARQLQAQKVKLIAAIGRLDALALAVTEGSATILQELYTNYLAAKNAAAVASADLFSGEPLPDIGSGTWKLLWEAARAYSQVSAYPDKPFPLTTPDARCVLCYQELDAAAADRLRRFEAFILNESKLKEATTLAAYDDALAALDAAKISGADLLALIALVRDDLGEVALAGQLRREIIHALWRMRTIAHAHRHPIPLALSPFLGLSSVELQRCADGLEQRAAALLAEQNSPVRRAQEAERDELADRAWLTVVQADVLAHIARLKDIAALAKATKDTTTNRITSKSVEIAKSLVTDRLRSKFAIEVNKLGVAGLAVELRPDKTSQGVPFFRVSLINKPTETVGNVLSEGEHRCVALAAFLAELSTVDALSAIVFDDPVSSLDHIHRERVAARLAEESLQRQIIVFTHDIAFLFLLNEACRAANAHVAFRCVSRSGPKAGFCQPNPPPNAQPLDKVIESIQRQLDNQKIHHERGNQEEWYRLVRSIQEQLRTAWERAVEDALAPVVRRLASKVDTKNLLKITVLNPTDCTVMRDAFGRCSELLHSEAIELNSPLPAPPLIEAEINALRSWVSDVRQRQLQVA